MNTSTTRRPQRLWTLIRTAVVALVALLGFSLLSPSLAAATTKSAPAPTSSKGPLIAVDKVKVWKGEEQNWNQNGDEPVVVNLMIRSTLGEKGTTRTAWVTDKPAELGSGIDNEDWVDVPDSQGDAHFVPAKPAIGGGDMSVRYLSQADREKAFDEGKTRVSTDVVMVVSFAFDGDFSGQETLMAFMNTIRERMLVKITPVLEAAVVPVDLAKLPDTMDAINAKVEKITVGIWDLLLNIDQIWSYVWKSGGDYDDLIGVSVVGYIPVDQSLVDALPMSAKDVGLDDNWTSDITARQKVGDGWINVPSQLGLLIKESGPRSITHVVQSDLPIEDHVGYDLKHHIVGCE